MKIGDGVVYRPAYVPRDAQCQDREQHGRIVGKEAGLFEFKQTGYERSQWVAEHDLTLDECDD